MATALQNRNGHQVRALEKVRKLRNVAREALAALRELEAAAEMDVVGRYEVHPDEPVDGEDLAAWVQIARAEYGGRPLELVLTAPAEHDHP